MTQALYMFLILVTTQALAQAGKTPRAVKSLSWGPPYEIKERRLPKATVPNEMVGTLRLGTVTITLEETMMDDIQKRLGGTIGNRGDAGDYLEWLCFQGVEPGGLWVLWLESGEIHGRSVGGFRWQHINHASTPDKRCKALQGAASRIELPLALHPGMQEAEVLKVLGKPTIRRGAKLVFHHEHESSNPNQPCTSMNTVTITIHNGLVAAIDVWKVTVS